MGVSVMRCSASYLRTGQGAVVSVALRCRHRRHDLRLAQAFRAAGEGGREATEPARVRERSPEEGPRWARHDIEIGSFCKNIERDGSSASGHIRSMSPRASALQSTPLTASARVGCSTCRAGLSAYGEPF